MPGLWCVDVRHLAQLLGSKNSNIVQQTPLYSVSRENIITAELSAAVHFAFASFLGLHF